MGSRPYDSCKTAKVRMQTEIQVILTFTNQWAWSDWLWFVYLRSYTSTTNCRCMEVQNQICNKNAVQYHSKDCCSFDLIVLQKATEARTYWLGPVTIIQIFVFGENHAVSPIQHSDFSCFIAVKCLLLHILNWMFLMLLFCVFLLPF